MTVPVDPHGPTRPPTWDGTERRSGTHSQPECPIAEEARRDVGELHRLLHGNGHDRGVFEQLRSMAKGNDDLAQAVFHLETKVGNFDHKLDEMTRIAREELQLAKEEVQLAKQAALDAKRHRIPAWMKGSAFVSLMSVGLFFAVRLWREMMGR